MPKLFKPELTHLSNGIPVILQHLDGSVAATYWWVRTGSADEASAEAGFAHFLEHMLFKDAAAKETGKASTGKMARAIESLGGDINAYTSFDQTVYHVTCAAHHWERVIDAFGPIAKPQRFLKDDFEREREVILEELRKNEDSPGRQLFQSLFSLTFKKHPYGRPVIGFAKILKSAKLSALEAFYKRNYSAGNMGLVLVGPIEDATGERKKSILRYAEKHFGGKVIPGPKSKGASARGAAAPVNKARPVEPALANTDLPPFKVQPFDVKTPTLSISFRAPDLLNVDTPALDILANILGMGEMGRLYQKLFRDLAIVTDISGGLYVPKDPGMLYFQAETTEVSKIEPAYLEIFRELARLRDEGPTPEELSRCVVNAESDRLYATQSADGMAGRIGFSKFVLGDLDYDQKYLEELRSIDAARVRAIAAEYLDPRRMSGVILVPKDHKNYDARPIAALARRILSRADIVTRKIETKARGAKKTPAGAAAVEFFTLPSGIRVACFERPNSHVLSLHASVLGGLRLEVGSPLDSADRDWGVSSLFASSWTKGTRGSGAIPGKSSLDIASIFEGRAASVDGFSGRNSVGLQMTSLARDWDALSPLFTEILTRPAFPEDEVAHSRRVAEESLRGIEDHSSQLCSKLFLETLFEHHPYGRLTTGSLESLAGLNPEKIRAYHEAWVRPERLVISASGAIHRPSFNAWLKELSDRVSEAAQKASARGKFPKGLPDEPPLKAPRWIERSKGREQVHIIVGGLGTKLDSEDRYAMRILSTLLGGQSGRLFIELREKKSLAYTVAPVSFEGIERGYAGTYIACAPQKRVEAIEGIRSVLERLASQGPTAAEMKRAREFYLGRRAMDLQSDSSIAAHHGLESLYGLPYLDENQLIRKVEEVTAKDVQKACDRYLVEAFMVTSSV
ncbi:MAG: pitrilysin family protein [Oligoflexia bacterium]|nr:pitrilysin family protein [Oligoflexia bacterium]